MHTVAVLLEAKKGKEEKLKQALLDVVEPSRSEDACIDYQLHQDNESQSKLLLFEVWINKEMRALQNKKPYIKELVSTLEKNLASPFQALMEKRIS